MSHQSILWASARSRIGLYQSLNAKTDQQTYLARVISTRRFNSRACGLELSVIG